MLNYMNSLSVASYFHIVVLCVNVFSSHISKLGYAIEYSEKGAFQLVINQRNAVRACEWRKTCVYL